MSTILGRPVAAVAATAAIAVATSTAVVATSMGAAHAAQVQFKGTLNGLNGTTSVAAAKVFVALCASDCVRSGAVSTFARTSASGAFTAAATVAPASYAVAVNDVHLIPGFAQTSGTGYLRREANNQWSITQSFAAATRVSVSGSAQAFTLANAIHNPQDKFTQTTSGTGSYLPCAGHTTTFKPTPFSDFPTLTGKVTYQWYAGKSRATVKPIAGARSTSYRPTASMTGQGLYVSMIASAPNRTSYDRMGSLGTVGNPLNCKPSLAPIAKRWISSYGKKSGKAKVGKRAGVVGAKVKAAGRKHRIKATYTWMVAGRTVAKKRVYTIPRSAKGKRLKVRVTFAAPGFKGRSKVINFGRIR